MSFFVLTISDFRAIKGFCFLQIPALLQPALAITGQCPGDSDELLKQVELSEAD